MNHANREETHPTLFAVLLKPCSKAVGLVQDEYKLW